MFLPSSEALAQTLVDYMANYINNSKYNERISQISEITNKISQISADMTKFAVDGKIDDTEKTEIKKILAPWIEKLVDMI